jgi:hypothetical protein
VNITNKSLENKKKIVEGLEKNLPKESGEKKSKK